VFNSQITSNLYSYSSAFYIQATFSECLASETSLKFSIASFFLLLFAHNRVAVKVAELQFANFSLKKMTAGFKRTVFFLKR
jgi:hypothetical protein